MLPSPPIYQETIQNPEICFSNPILKQSTVDRNHWDIPNVRSGGFALTYKLVSDGDTYAVRCFHKHAPEREYRYAAISKFLNSNPSKVLIPVKYEKKGILVLGKWYPITHMQWVEGDTLQTFLDRYHRDSARINNLINEFIVLVDELERLGIAHGDLSLCNIIISNNKMVLIDYDGMYVPELKGRQSIELGHIQYQHPRRYARNFDNKLDRFSSIVIYLGLVAIAKNPSLWVRFAGEGILFGRSDFELPLSSKLLQEIALDTELKPFISKFHNICQTDLEYIPKLTDIINDVPINIPVIERKIQDIGYSGQYHVYPALSKSTLLSNIGERVEVIGKVTDIHEGRTKYGPKPGSPFIFVNFSNFRNKDFTIVMWAETIELYNNSGRDPEDLISKWISCTGVLSEYGSRPQIVLESPKDLEILQNKMKADERLLSAPGKIGRDTISEGKLRTGSLSDSKEHVEEKKAVQQIQTLDWLQGKTPSGVLDDLYGDDFQSTDTVKSSNLKIGQNVFQSSSDLSNLYSQPTTKKKEIKIQKPSNFNIWKKFSENARIIIIISFLIITSGLLFYFLFVRTSNPNKTLVYRTIEITRTPEKIYITQTTDTTEGQPDFQVSPTVEMIEPTQKMNNIFEGCATGNLRIRSEPNDESIVNGWLVKGDCINVDGQTSDNHWYRLVDENDNVSGWVASRWIEMTIGHDKLDIIEIEDRELP